jgi:hypothetical protein
MSCRGGAKAGSLEWPSVAFRPHAGCLGGGKALRFLHMATARARIEELAEELAALSPEDRTRVLAAVERRGPNVTQACQKPGTWQRLRRLEGIVSVGGDALADCARLYDG